MLAWALLCCAVTPLMADNRGLERIGELDGVSEYRLANGLRAILAPDAKSTAIAFNMIYLTGSLDGPQGQGGTAHLLEHLLFKDTATVPGAQLIEGLSQRGIKLNATTSFDRTHYMAFLAADADKLNHLLALEADRMFSARLDQADLQAEIEVVVRELELAQDNPLSALGQQMFAATTPGQGLGRPVLGSREELTNIGVEQLRAFYREYYRPDNAVIVITGKFDSKQTLAAIKQHFTPLATLAGIAEKQPLAVPVLDKPVTAQLKRGDNEWLALAYPLPAASDQANSKKVDSATLYIAEHLQGRSQMVSRLSRRVREQEGLTYGIKSSMKIATFDDASWLMIQTGYPLGDGPRVADMAREELQRLIEDGITEQELHYAKQTILHERQLAVA